MKKLKNTALAQYAGSVQAVLFLFLCCQPTAGLFERPQYGQEWGVGQDPELPRQLTPEQYYNLDWALEADRQDLSAQRHEKGGRRDEFTARFGSNIIFFFGGGSDRRV